MRIFNLKSDFVVIHLNNNGCAFVQIEGRTFEMDRASGEAWVREARNQGYVEKYYTRCDNGDHRYYFN